METEIAFRHCFSGASCATDTRKLEKLAASMGHLYGGKGKPGALLDLLASGDFVLVPKNATDVIKSVAQLLEETSPSALKLERSRGDATQTIPAGSQQI
ncbi:MAG: hypothetical protein HC894_02440 [Microcoleus sp. SM1_3_4]|nr:hypothetical protein [Microcoleus sp. SM1_3_4]